MVDLSDKAGINGGGRVRAGGPSGDIGIRRVEIRGGRGGDGLRTTGEGYRTTDNHQQLRRMHD